NAFFYGRPISWRAARENCGFHLPTPIETTHFWPKPDSTRTHDNYPAIPTHFRVVVPPQYCYQPAKDVYWKFIEGAYRPIIEYESDAGLLPLMGIWQKTEPITGNAFFYGRPISWRAARENCGFHLPTPIETTHFWPKPDSTRTHVS
ncbi:unnamed protein product, partial [Cyprideis torosa]